MREFLSAGSIHTSQTKREKRARFAYTSERENDLESLRGLT